MKPLLTFILSLAMSLSFGADFSTKSIGDEIAVMKGKLTNITIEKAKAFILAYVDPAEMEKINKEGGVDAVAKMFVEDKKAEDLLKFLNAIDISKAKVDDAGKIIGFEIKDAIKNEIKFHFVDGKWYLVN